MVPWAQKSAPQRTSRSVIFATLQQKLPMLFNGADNSHKLSLLLAGSNPHLIIIPWAHQSQTPNGISIGSAVFAGVTNVTNIHSDTQTDTQTDWLLYSICSNSLHLMPCIQCGLRSYSLLSMVKCKTKNNVVKYKVMKLVSVSTLIAMVGW